MKILFVSDLSYGSTAKMRMSNLEMLGHHVKPIDVNQELLPGFALRQFFRISWRLGWPLDLSRVNSRLIEIGCAFEPDIIWIDKGVYVRRETLSLLRHQIPRLRLVHYNPDDPFGKTGKRGWRTFIKAIPAYDVHFVPRRENVAEYAACGAAHVYHNIPTRGFDPAVHRPFGDDNDLRHKFACEVGFLGAYERQRSESLQRLAKSGIRIRLMADWPEQHWHPNFLRAPFRIQAEQYAKAIGSFKIALGFLRKANRDQHTSRSIEIPACGTLLMAERTEEHLMLFEEGKEAEFFDSDDELIEKVNFYLANDRAREVIARAGRERCLRSGYDYRSRLCQMLTQVVD